MAGSGVIRFDSWIKPHGGVRKISIGPFASRESHNDPFMRAPVWSSLRTLAAVALALILRH